jgi:hypothetical protein
MTTKAEFLAQAEIELGNAKYAKISALNTAKDPRILASIGAMAQMLELYSMQQDLAETEVFVKARDATILADATLKGILPLAKAAQVQVLVTNPSANSVTLAYGRRLLDDKGRVWRVASTLVVAANSTGTVDLNQNELRTINHTIANSDPFYTITLPQNEEGLYLENIRIKDTIGNTDNLYRYAPEFMNVLNGERVYHLETDEARQITIRLGAQNNSELVYGFQTPINTVLTIELTETTGKLDIATGASFSLEYSNNIDEDALKIAIVLPADIKSLGANPLSLSVLAQLSKYNALYDHSAVYLSDFDFLIRRYHGDSVNFLAVWNEQIEEQLRPASVANINKLFIAVQAKNALEQANLELYIHTLVQRADNSYKRVVIPVIDQYYPLTINASVAAIHDSAQVTQQIKDTLLAIYGVGQIKVSQGLKNNFNRQEIYQTLKRAIPAFQDSISDFNVVVGVLPDPILPEHYFYLHPTTNFTVAVTQLSDAGGGLWN